LSEGIGGIDVKPAPHALQLGEIEQKDVLRFIFVAQSLHSDPSAAQGAPEASRLSATDPRVDIVRRGLPPFPNPRLVFKSSR
jgi:hypothetical protein